MLTDVRYAIKQLREINAKSLDHAGQYTTLDRIDRALDALARVEAELASEQTVTVSEADLQLYVPEPE